MHLYGEHDPDSCNSCHNMLSILWPENQRGFLWDPPPQASGCLGMLTQLPYFFFLINFQEAGTMFPSPVMAATLLFMLWLATQD